MLFENKGKEKKRVRTLKSNNLYEWKWVREGEKINVPKEIGESYGLSAVEEVKAKSGNKTIETKREKKDSESKKEKQSDMETKDKKSMETKEKNVKNLSK